MGFQGGPSPGTEAYQRPNGDSGGRETLEAGGGGGSEIQTFGWKDSGKGTWNEAHLGESCGINYGMRGLSTPCL